MCTLPSLCLCVLFDTLSDCRTYDAIPNVNKTSVISAYTLKLPVPTKNGPEKSAQFKREYASISQSPHFEVFVSFPHRTICRVNGLVHPSPPNNLFKEPSTPVPHSCALSKAIRMVDGNYFDFCAELIQLTAVFALCANIFITCRIQFSHSLTFKGTMHTFCIHNSKQSVLITIILIFSLVSI